MPFDRHGGLMRQTSNTSVAAASGHWVALAPPRYGEHILDRLYEDGDFSASQTLYTFPASCTGGIRQGELTILNRVPSYATAVRTLAHPSAGPGELLLDHHSAHHDSRTQTAG